LGITLVPPQVAQPDRARLDVVQRGQRVCHVVADAAPRGLVECGLRLGRAAQDVALDELHHVERALVHRLVGAQADGDRHRDAGRAERVHEAVLAGHVMGGGQHVVQRGSSQRPRVPRRVLDPEGQIRAAARDQSERERRRELGQLRGHPLGDPRLVDSRWRLRHGSRR